MSGAISIGTMAMVGAGVAGGMMLSGAMSKPKINIPQPEKPKQGAQAADREGIVRANTMGGMPGGAMAGNAGTFLTGPSGIDPSTLNLGKNTLLGQ
jgi:hypothetical protein